MMKWCVFLLKRTFPNTLFVFGFSSVLFTISLSSLSLSFWGVVEKKGGMIHKTYPKDQKKQVKDNLI